MTGVSDKELLENMQKAWVRRGRPETVCGRGSRIENTVNVRAILPVWIERYGIKTLTDAGAGDLHWMGTLALNAVVSYYDLIPRHEKVIAWDITKEQLPPCDAILCRYVLNHLDVKRVLEALSLFKKSAKYLIANTFSGPPDNPPSFVCYDLSIMPFNLGFPLEQITDCRGDLAIWKLEAM